MKLYSIHTGYGKLPTLIAGDDRVQVLKAFEKAVNPPSYNSGNAVKGDEHIRNFLEGQTNHVFWAGGTLAEVTLPKEYK